LSFAGITLQAVVDGKVGMDDFRVTPEALELQAQVADAAGRPQLAENLRRAAELVNVPEEVILEIYRALRPGRADRDALYTLAAGLESRYGATRCAALVREAVSLQPAID
jgi:propanediol dehydratase small subunit